MPGANTSLLQTFVNYGSKMFHKIWPRLRHHGSHCLGQHLGVSVMKLLFVVTGSDKNEQVYVPSIFQDSQIFAG